MAKFLTTGEISGHIERIIREADEFLEIISPYLNGMSPLIQRRIKSKCQEHQVSVLIIYRHEKKQSANTEEWLSSMPNVFAGFCENLHAKCYMNEKEALITSLNLTEYAQANNYEMGMLVSSDTEFDLYKSIYDEANQISQASTRVYEPEWSKISRLEGERLRREQQLESTSEEQQASLPKFGFCLRCGAEIPCSPERPYCNSDYRTWARFKDESYEEKRCHTCGSDHSSSMAKPLCLSCFRKYGGVLRAAG